LAILDQRIKLVGEGNNENSEEITGNLLYRRRVALREIEA
jgi:hypothetical protein